MANYVKLKVKGSNPTSANLLTSGGENLTCTPYLQHWTNNKALITNTIKV